MCNMSSLEKPVVGQVLRPHARQLSLKMVEMLPVPLFSRQRNGCRPFCEVYVNENRVMSTSTDYDSIR